MFDEKFKKNCIKEQLYYIEKILIDNKLEKIELYDIVRKEFANRCKTAKSAEEIFEISEEMRAEIARYRDWIIKKIPIEDLNSRRRSGSFLDEWLKKRKQMQDKTK